MHYEMPRSTNIHKSMILRGTVFAPPALDRADIEATQGRANRSGRSYGGAPLRGDFGNGRGRGGHINFADSRPNPFAAHINPNLPPRGMQNDYRGGPPPPPMGGWAPPLHGADEFWRGPPPPPNSYGNSPHGYAPPGHNFNYGRPPAPLPPQGYQNGYQDGNFGNRFSNNNQYGPPPDGRFGGQDDRIGR